MQTLELFYYFTCTLINQYLVGKVSASIANMCFHTLKYCDISLEENLQLQTLSGRIHLKGV